MSDDKMNRREFFKRGSALIPAISALKAMAGQQQSPSYILAPPSPEVEHALIRSLQKHYGAMHVKDMRTLASDNIHINEPAFKNITDTLERLKKRVTNLMGTPDAPVKLAKEVLFFRVDDDAKGDQNWLMSSTTKQSDDGSHAVMSCSIKAQYLTPFLEQEKWYDQDKLENVLAHELGHHLLRMNGWLLFDDLFQPLSTELRKELADFKANPLSAAEEEELNKITSAEERADERQRKIDNKINEYLDEMNAEKIATLLTGMKVAESQYSGAEPSKTPLNEQGMDPHPSFAAQLAELRVFSKMIQKGAKLDGLPKTSMQR